MLNCKININNRILAILSQVKIASKYCLALILLLSFNAFATENTENLFPGEVNSDLFAASAVGGEDKGPSKERKEELSNYRGEINKRLKNKQLKEEEFKAKFERENLVLEGADSIRIIIPAEESTSGALFYHHSDLILALQGDLVNKDFEELKKFYPDLIITRSGKNNIFHFPNWPHKSCYLEKSGKTNQLMCYKQFDTANTPTERLTDFATYEFDNNNLLFDHPQLKGLIFYEDPITGDKIYAATVGEYDFGQPLARNMIDADLLYSPTGMGFIKNNDKLGVNFKENNLTIEFKNHDLNRTEAADLLQSGRNIDPQDDFYNKQGLFSHERQDKLIDRVNKQTFSADEKDLRRAVLAKKSELDKDQSRYNLAKFYFSHELYNEAVLYLNLMSAKEKFGQINDKIKLLKAISLINISHQGEAKKMLKTITPEALPSQLKKEYLLWWGYINYWEDRSSKVPFLEYYKNLIGYYPENFMTKLALADINSSLEREDVSRSEKLLSVVRDFDSSGRAKHDIKLAQANYLFKKSKQGQARKLLRQLAVQNEDQKVSTMAMTRLIEHNLARRVISPGRAVQLLEENRFGGWRGGYPEYELLMKKAEIQEKNGKIIEALESYSDVFKVNYDQMNKLLITRKMVKLYNKIFDTPEILNTMTDYEVVNLFYEYKELIPIGDAGDQVVLIVADKLANLGMLDTAESLLSHQINYRLQGDKKLSAAEKLAGILIADEKPQEAIEILHKTDNINTDYNRHLKRRRIKSKALIEQENFEKALEILSHDKGKMADELRAEIYFLKEDWENLAELLEPKVTKIIEEHANKDKQAGNLTSEEEDQVIKVIIAYAFLKENTKLTALKQSINEKNNKQVIELIDYFLSQDRPVDYKNIEESLQLDVMSKFINNLYQEQAPSLDDEKQGGKNSENTEKTKEK